MGTAGDGGAAPAGPGGIPGSASAPDGGAGGPASRRTLLYIVGHHRSGATALGAILGAHPGWFFAGELYRFPVPIWTSGDGRRGCSCGLPVLACPFWSEVRRDADEVGLLGALADGQRRFERWAAVPRSLLALAAGRPAILAHVRAISDFDRLVAARSGATVLVEYGPSAARARVCRELERFGFEVRFLHLVRDGRGFLASELATPNDPEAPGPWVHFPAIVVARWLGMNLAAIALCARGRSRYLRVRYEELLLDPGRTLGRIGAFVGTDLSGEIERIEAGRSFPMRHIAAGNRARLQGTLVLAREPPSTDSLPWSRRALFWVLAGWFAALLGYGRRRPDRGAGRPAHPDADAVRPPPGAAARVDPDPLEERGGLSAGRAGRVG